MLPDTVKAREAVVHWGSPRASRVPRPQENAWHHGPGERLTVGRRLQLPHHP